jgi:hypothetical protein
MSQLLTNKEKLQEALNILQTKAAPPSTGGGEQATPVITINSSTGLITATAGTKSATKQLAFQAAKTITPTTTNQTAVAANTYVGGAITVTGDANLVAENIRKNETIFGVTGTYEATGGADTSDATATADEIFAGETAYGANGKVTGTFTIDSELATQNTLIPQIRAALKGKALPPGSTSNPTAPKKDVNFYDYDGTRLYSYTVEEAQALTELPPLPTQPGLICQEWNYDLDTIKSYNRAMDVGATYVTDDGKTRLYIRIESDRVASLPLYFNQSATNGVIIDWGDGSLAQTLDGIGYVNTKHTYSSIGDYVITLEVVDGDLILGGYDSEAGTIEDMLVSILGVKPYVFQPQKVEIGYGVVIIDYNAFENCFSLSSITIPNSVTSIGTEAFSDCYSLSSITIPNSVTSIDAYAFSSCYSLSSITIPNSVTSIGEGAFYYCHSLSSITIPSSVTSIGNYAFSNCSSLSTITIPNSVTSIAPKAFQTCWSILIYDFASHTSVPTLANTNTFTGISSGCKIKVPSALYAEWRAATNWSTYASHIVAV